MRITLYTNKKSLKGETIKKMEAGRRAGKVSLKDFISFGVKLQGRVYRIRNP